MRRTLLILLTMTAALLAGPQPARAATVRFDVQPRSTYVGVPVSLHITIEDAEEVEAPELPDLADFNMLGPPGRSEQSFTSIVNGKMTSTQSVSYTYRLAPTRTGRLTIPAIRFDVDGQTFQTDSVIINVEEPRNEGLLNAEVVAPVDSVYVGEGVELTLRITVERYVDSRYDVRLSDGDMWRLLQTEESQWGVFQPVIDELQQNNRTPSSRIVRRGGGLSDEDLLYQFELTRIVYPDAPGEIDLGHVTLLMQYPISLSRFMLSGYSVERSRPVVAAVDTPDVEVVPLPEADRPDLFNGAVGAFTMNVEVKPIDVAVGEPITVTMTLTDRSDPAAQLDVLKAPSLHEVSALTDMFRVHEEPLAGTVRGRNKSFTQTIRARSEAVADVPPIPFTFFDPQRETYVTIKSDPIPITVRPASRLAMSDIELPGRDEPETTELTPVTNGLLANFGDPGELLRRESLEPAWWIVIVLAAPPVLFAVVAISHRRADRLRRDPAMVRQRRAFKRADEALALAARQQSDAEAHITSAVAGYVADRCNLPPGAHTRADVAACLQQRRVPAQLIDDVTNLMQRCEHAAYTGAMNGSPGELAGEAKAILTKLERVKWS